MTRPVAGDWLLEQQRRTRWTTVEERGPLAERLRAAPGDPPK